MRASTPGPDPDCAGVLASTRTPLTGLTGNWKGGAGAAGSADAPGRRTRKCRGAARSRALRGRFSAEMPSRGERPEDGAGLVPAEGSTLHKEELSSKVSTGRGNRAPGLLTAGEESRGPRGLVSTWPCCARYRERDTLKLARGQTQMAVRRKFGWFCFFSITTF